MGKYDELVEGLRELHEKFVGQAGRNYTAALFGEVATAIATLEAELAEAQQQVKGALIMHEALSEKLEITQDELAAMKALGDRLAGFAEHDSDCVLGIPKAIRSRSSIQEECTCGLTQALTDWRDQ